MKLSTLNEYAFNLVHGGFITTPANITDLTKRDFVDKEFELEFLGDLKTRKDLSPGNAGVPLKPMSYIQVNRVKNLNQAGFCKIIDVDGKPTAFLTAKGEEWVRGFESAKASVASPVSVGPAWNPVMGSGFGGMK